MSAGALLAISDQYRAMLAAREAAAVAQMMSAYLQVRNEVLRTLDALTADIEAATAAGEDVSLAWLFRQERYHLLLRQTDQQISALMPYIEGIITGEQAEAVGLAVDAFEQLTLFQLPPDAAIRAQLTRLPVSALEHLVGATADGSPLRDLLDQLGPDASKRVRDELIRGVGIGRNPRETARRIRDALDGNMTRANAISRTETLRAYTNASLENYRANEDIMAGWVWHAKLDTRTCAYCWAMHGTILATESDMAKHVNCRCAAIPYTKTWAELGFTDIPETRIDVPRGADVFETLSDADKLQILGPAKFAAYKDERLGLLDLIGQKDDPKWGKVGYEKSLKDALGARQAQTYYQQAADD